MNVLLTQTILAVRSSEGDDTIWVQMLILVILAVFFGIYSLSKVKSNKFTEHNQNQSQQHLRGQIQPVTGTNRELLSSTQAIEPNVNGYNKSVTKALKKSPGERERDLHSGMELLELNFLLSIVEDINGGDDDEKDVAIRKLNFKELLRRGKLNEADSNALKMYATKGNLYGKDIQCEAIKKLAERSARSSKHNT